MYIKLFNWHSIPDQWCSTTTERNDIHHDDHKAIKEEDQNQSLPLKEQINKIDVTAFLVNHNVYNMIST